MFKPHINICANPSCGKRAMIVVKRGLCCRCNYDYKQAKKAKPNEKLTPKTGKEFSSLKKKLRKPTGELKMYNEIWNERPHVSELSDKPIKYFDINCFMHVLGKKAYPRFRLYKPNIILGLTEEHHRQHNGTLPPELLNKFKDKQEELKQQYYQLQK